MSPRDIGSSVTQENHLEERLLDQAQARASYTPLFWGHSRSIPQGMILDVQPLVKSLFCPIRPSPNGFFDSEASPKTGYYFFERGGGGGVNSFRSEGSKQWGGIPLSHHRRSIGNAADAKFSVGGSNPGWPIVGGSSGAIFARSGFEPPTKRSAVSCITAGGGEKCDSHFFAFSAFFFAFSGQVP